MARAIILDEAGTIAPKSRGLVQLVLDEPVVALSGDRFIVRDQTNVRTLGGGVVLNPLGRKIRKPLDVYRKNLDALAAMSGPASIEALLNLQEALALTPSRIAQLLNLPIADVDAALKDPRFVKLSMGDEEGYTTANKWAELKAFALAALAKHHAAEPLSPGLEMEALRSRLPYEIGARNYRALANRLARETDIVREESTLRLKSSSREAGRERRQAGLAHRGGVAQGGVPASGTQAACRDSEAAVRPKSENFAACCRRSSVRARSSRSQPISISRAPHSTRRARISLTIFKSIPR